MAPSLGRRLSASLLLDAQVVAAVALCMLYSAAVVRLQLAGNCPAWLATGASKISASLASVLGLLLAFRSNASAGRWDASRKAWTDIHAQARALVRMLSTAPTIKPLPLLVPASSAAPPSALVQQREVLRLSAAFALAVAIQLFGGTIPYPSALRLDDDNEHNASSSERVELLALYSLVPPRLYANQTVPAPAPPSSGLSSDESFHELRTKLRRRRLGRWHSDSKERTGEIPSEKERHSQREDQRRKQYSERAREKRLLHDADEADFLTAILPRSAADGPANVALDILTELQKRLEEMYANSSRSSTPASNDAAVANGNGNGPTVLVPQLSLAAPIYAHSTGALNTLAARLTELEAIRDTTTPPLLRIHLSHVLVINQLLLPWSLAPTLVWWTPVAAGLIGYVFVALYHLAESLAQPFRRGDWNALPLRRWAAEVVREVKEAEAGLSSE